MTNQTKRRYCIRNWREYNKALVRRGSLTLWVEQRAVDRWRKRSRPARRGRRRLYSDLAITCALTLRDVYGLPLRATQGLAASVLRLLGTDLSAALFDALAPGRAARSEAGAAGRGPAAPGGGLDGWKKEVDYHWRSLAETAMRRLKTILSGRLKAREWRRQETELRVRCAALNRMTSLGMPPSYPV